MNVNSKRFGVSIVEAVVAISVIVTVLGFTVSIASLSLKSATNAKFDIQMTLLAEEGIEGARVAWKANQTAVWNLPSGSTYCLVTSTTVTLATSECDGYPPGFSRGINLTYANVSGEVLSNGSSIPDTRRVTVTVNGPGGRSKTLVTVFSKF